MADDAEFEFGRPKPATPPPIANIESEAVLLGTLLSYPERIESIADILNAEDFAEGVHGSIYQAMVDAATAGRMANAFTLAPLFKDDKRFERLGGGGYLFQLSGAASAMVMVKEQAEQIADLAARRRLIASLAECGASAADLEKPLSSLIDEADAALVAAIERRTGGASANAYDTAGLVIDELEALIAGGDKPGATTGVDEFDKLTGGLRPGDFTIIAARPGMGKTAVLCSLSVALASRGHGVGIFELEMERRQLAQRMLCDMAFTYGGSVNFDAIMTGELTEDEMERLRALRNVMRSWPLEIEDRGGLSLSRLIILARRMRRRMAAKGQKLQVLFVDYMQLIRPDRKGMSPYEAATETAREMKALAKELGIHVVALSQLSREVEKRDDKTPQLSDLRDSGEIEAAADMVMFLYREEYYLQHKEPKDPLKVDRWKEDLRRAQNQLQLILAKRRSGKTGRQIIYYFTGNQAIRGKGWHR